MKRLTLLVGMLKANRTEHAKAIRRQYGDGSGMCRFGDKYYTIANDGIANTITAGLDKFNLLATEYEYV